MLSFAEEIYLLALDEHSGKIMPDVRNPVLGTAIIAAVLIELAFLNRISTDESHIYILDTKPTESPVLNDVLETLKESDKKSAKIKRVLKALMSHAKRLEEMVLKELVKKGILKEIDDKIFWIFPDRRYPLIDNKEIASVETRIRRLILSNGKPDPKDAALVSLLQASKLFQKILSEEECLHYKERIEQLAEMSDIGKNTEDLIYKIRDLPDSPYPDLLTEEDTIV